MQFSTNSNQRQFMVLCGAILGGFVLSSWIWNSTRQSDTPQATIVVYPPSRLSCKEDRHVIFLKVIKSGSTTLQNIFYRYGISRNLTFMLPRVNNWLSKTRIINKDSILPSRKAGLYDILCNHVRYNKTDLARFTHKDTKTIAIIREPGSHLKSYLYYYHLNYLTSQPSKEVDIVQKYLRHPKNFTGKILSNPTSEWFSLVLNTSVPSVTKFRKSLIALDKGITLVLVLERLDESLVLMKRLLCWNIEDIIYISQNTNQMYPKGNFTEADKIRHQHISKFDYILYKFFSSKLDSIIKESGEDFHEEVLFFRKVLVSVRQFCVDWRKKLGTTLIIERSFWSREFRVSSIACLHLTFSELEFQNYVGLWQYGEVWKTVHRDS